MGNNLYNPDMEEAAISCVLNEPSSFSYLKDILQPADFYWKPYSWLWETFGNIVDRNVGIDDITVRDELQRKDLLDAICTATGNIKGEEALEKVKSSRLFIIDNAEGYALQVKDDSANRKIIEVANKTLTWINQGNNANVVLSNMEIELSRIQSFAGSRNIHIEDSATVVDRAVESTKKASLSDKKYIETGLRDLDNKIGGLFNGTVTLVAGRAGEGKSSFLLTLAMNMAIHSPTWKRKVGIFSLEMSNEEYMQRMISYISGISSLRLKMGKVFKDEYERKCYDEAVTLLKNSKIILDDSPSLTLSQLRAKLRKMKDMGVEIVMIDQLNLLDPSMKNADEYVKINFLVNQLKVMSREVDIPLVVAHQLSRGIESTMRSKDKEPKNSDLSQAGENGADIIMIITHEKQDNVIVSSKVSVTKNRHGATGGIKINFMASNTKFTDADNEEVPEFLKDDNG